MPAYRGVRRSALERETGIEPATNSLEGCDSTIELLPRSRLSANLNCIASIIARRSFLLKNFAETGDCAPRIERVRVNNVACRKISLLLACQRWYWRLGYLAAWGPLKRL